MRNKTKKIMKYLTIGVALNYPVFFTFRNGVNNLIRTYFDNQIEIKSEEEHLKKYKSPDQSLGARDYLNLANGVITRYSNLEQVCRHRSEGTFQFYLKLIEENQREDLEDKVRIAESISGRHVWLEIKEREKWTPYESMIETPLLSLEEVKEYSQRTISEKSTINIKGGAEFLSIAGTNISYPVAKQMYLGGMVGFVYAAVRGANENQPKPL